MSCSDGCTIVKIVTMVEVWEVYIEGYVKAMLDSLYRQEYLRVRVIDNQVIVELSAHKLVRYA